MIYEFIYFISNFYHFDFAMYDKFKIILIFISICSFFFNLSQILTKKDMVFIIKPIGADLTGDHNIVGKSDPYCIILIANQKF